MVQSASQLAQSPLRLPSLLSSTALPSHSSPAGSWQRPPLQPPVKAAGANRSQVSLQVGTALLLIHIADEELPAVCTAKLRHSPAIPHRPKLPGA